MGLKELLFRNKDRSTKKDPVVPGSEGNVNKPLGIEIRPPTIDEDAEIWRKVGEEYFKIPGVIRKALG